MEEVNREIIRTDFELQYPLNTPIDGGRKCAEKSKEPKKHMSEVRSGKGENGRSFEAWSETSDPRLLGKKISHVSLHFWHQKLCQSQHQATLAFCCSHSVKFSVSLLCKRR